MKSGVLPIPKRGEVIGQGETKIIPSSLRWKTIASCYGDSIIQRLGDLGRPMLVLTDSLISWELHEPLPSRKKELELTDGISVLSIKFHYIYLIYHRRWFLAWGYHSSLDDFSSHHFVLSLNCPTLTCWVWLKIVS